MEKLKRMSENVRTNRIPSLVDAGYLTGLFKHFSFPTYIWIDTQGYIKYITNSAEIKEEKIRGFITGSKLNLKEKKDIKLNTENPLLVEWYPYDKTVSLYSFLKPKNLVYSKTGGSSIRKDKEGFITRAYHEIATRQSIYPFVFGFHFNQHLAQNRFIEIYSEKWDENRRKSLDSIEFYTFDFMSDKKINDQQVRTYLKTLYDTYFNIKSSLQKRTVKTFVLKKYSNTILYKTKGGEAMTDVSNNMHKMTNRRWHLLMSRINSTVDRPYEIIDETGIGEQELIDLEIEFDLGDLLKLNKGLKKSGLYIEEQQRELDCIVLEYL